ncbi:MAG: ABC transporter substrate-binding protein [Solimonas sp.]
MAALARWVAAALLSFAGAAPAADLCLAAPSDAQLPALQAQLDRWQRETGQRVELVKLSNAGSDVFVQYRTWLAAHSPAVDVYKLDSQWVGQLGAHLLDLGPRVDEARRMFPNVLEAYRAPDGALLALPYTVGVPLLYYRRDLLQRYGLPVPKTWTELTTTARRIRAGERAAGRRAPWGYVFQAAAYEGLTANAMEWIASNGGGRIVEPDGRISVNNPRAAAALRLAASWVGDIAPRGVLNYREDDARGVFQTGDAVFMRNWPAIWELLRTERGSAVAGRFDVAPLPAGEAGRVAATLGGWGFAVSRHSRRQEQAVRLVQFLTREEAQRDYARRGLPPTYPALYDDPQLIREAPLLPLLKDIVPQALARPSAPTGRHYAEVSTEFWSATHEVLEGRTDPAAALAGLDAILRQVRRQGW